MSVEIILMIGFGILACVVYCIIIGYRQIGRNLRYRARCMARFITRRSRPSKPSKLGKREAPW